MGLVQLVEIRLHGSFFDKADDFTPHSARRFNILLYVLFVRYIKIAEILINVWIGDSRSAPSRSYRFVRKQAPNILMMKISTPIVSPHFSTASERNREMQCFFVRNSSFLKGGKWWRHSCLSGSTWRHVPMRKCTEVEKPCEPHAIPVDGRHVARREF